MNLSISNIAWDKVNDEPVFGMMKTYGFTGLEIAPTIIFPENPYEHLSEAKCWSEKMMAKYGFLVSSMQSIWFGKQERVFGSKEERNALLEYTKKAIDFASTIRCKNLVFGCPRNRVIPQDGNVQIAIDFFKELGDYAYERNTVIGMEANPPIYNTNFINDTVSAIDLIDRVDSKGFLLNLDIGTMIENCESVEILRGKVKYINHVHVSEPGLKIIERRDSHVELAKLLKTEGYKGFVSVEMSKTEELDTIENVFKYLKNIFK